MPASIQDRLRNAPKTGPDQIGREAVELAAELLEDSHERQSEEERAQAAKIARMMEDPLGKSMTMAMSDQAFRSHEPARVAEQLSHLVNTYGVPTYFATWEQMSLYLGSLMGQYMPQLVVPLLVAKLRQETRSVILPSEEQEFREYVASRRATGTRLNLNQLGEAILGEEEAERRLDSYLRLLAREDVEYISVKISSIFSQLHLVAFDETVESLRDRLRKLYRAAMLYHWTKADGTRTHKFVNLDMEEYRDLHLTLAAFRKVLEEPEFFRYRAGVVLQAYLPDSHPVQRELTQWAMERVARGGAPIKLRIVKGANLAMERVEAAHRDWPQAPYTNKRDVDANYKRMVAYGCRPEHARAVNLGLATHNLFDVAYGLIERARNGVEQHVEFEMLEGMANHQARAVQEAAGGLLLYAPVVRAEDFHSAISYLVRRLDENTAEENFLHDLFGMQAGSAAWEKQKAAFLDSLAHRDAAPEGPRRTQDRGTETRSFDPEAPFSNEPDTDWSLPHNSRWIRGVFERWRAAPPESVPAAIAGREVAGPRVVEGRDPSNPGAAAYRHTQATREQVEEALESAVQARAAWSSESVSERKRILVRCAEELARDRGELLGAMALDGAKTALEGDAEVSEAVDYANYYARALDLAGEELTDARSQPVGTVLVTPPWNFPLAIPAGGVLASLIAGNTVILKPAPEAVLVSWKLCQALWRAGVPRNVLQFVPTSDDEVGQALVTDSRADTVILTGGYSTARMFQIWKPQIRLLAETSGKNSLIVSAMADHDQAIKDLIHSAFGHNGQKCSAASLAVLEDEVYDSESFRRQLRDAAASLHAGPVWDLTSKITPLIREPGSDLKRALTTLEEGETWLLEPKQSPANPMLWTPGIKLGVRSGSFFERTECFGPVLGLVRVRDLAEAIDIVNASEYGLTSGIHSLDDREVDTWIEQAEAGNLYVNRATTGAIVRRQPFGGWKKSVFGAAAKAGGPNYALNLLQWRQETMPEKRMRPDATTAGLLRHLLAAGARHSLLGDEEIRWLEASAASYAYAWHDHFSVAHDPSGIPGEHNLFRYRRLRNLVLRVERGASWLPIAQVVLAAQVCEAPLRISVAPAVESAIFDGLAGQNTHVESESKLLEWTRRVRPERIRLITPPTARLQHAAQDSHTVLIDAPVLANGRLELRHYLIEQAVSRTVHRYGNIISKPGA